MHTDIRARAIADVSNAMNEKLYILLIKNFFKKKNRKKRVRVWFRNRVVHHFSIVYLDMNVCLFVIHLICYSYDSWYGRVG